MSFTELGLKPELLRALADAEYTVPTPIQTQAIPAVLRGEDVLGCAQTGTGKTAAFLLPILARLEARTGARPRVLVVAPTRELAAQIGESAKQYGKYLPFRSVVIHGGVAMSPQTDKLRRGVDFIIATPGRLLDHMERRNISFADIQVVVLDEADRMLDMGFLPSVRRILEALPKKRQTLLFSATMPAEIEDLIRRSMNTPFVVEVTRRATTGNTVKQVVHPVSGDDKRDLLVRLLEGREMGQVLVFTRTKVRADRLAKHLAKTGRKVAAIHGNKSQGARTSALEGFKSGRIDTLVATDIAARGIDVDGISHVVNFDLPMVAEDYVHRIGRTARAGASGHAVSLVSPEEAGQVRAIERLIGMSIPREAVAGFAVPTAAAVVRQAQPQRPYGGRPQGPQGSRGAHGSQGARPPAARRFGGGGGGNSRFAPASRRPSRAIA